MADKNISELLVNEIPLLGTDLTLVSRNGISINKTSLSDIKDFALSGLTIETSEISDGAVTLAKLSSNSVDSSKIVNGSILSEDIGNFQITEDKINLGAVTSDKLASNSVNSSKIVDGSIGTDELANSSVTSSKLAGTIAIGTLSTNEFSSPIIKSSDFIKDSAGTRYHGVVQVVSKVITTQGSQSLVANSADTLVGSGSDFEVVFTPRLSGSFVKLTIRWFGEISTSWDAVFNVHRNSIRLNNASTAPMVGLSMATQTYTQGDNSSTPEILHLITLDKTGTVSGTPITYRLVVSAGSTAQTIWTNRTFAGAGTGGNEAGVSEIIIEEYAQ